MSTFRASPQPREVGRRSKLSEGEAADKETDRRSQSPFAPFPLGSFEAGATRVLRSDSRTSWNSLELDHDNRRR